MLKKKELTADARLHCHNLATRARFAIDEMNCFSLVGAFSASTSKNALRQDWFRVHTFRSRLTSKEVYDDFLDVTVQSACT
jgi:hypothetical protein